ncbi:MULTISPECIES: DUF6912 family protein [unclassified Streptomyces]|uniref:DUF6912 family protein n=1 Tax=unclassified Streptomyces TaxID=2593676 RepID=UPI001370786E|nr:MULTISPECIES: hypothetical protein [unclassified Streptomyces]MCW5252787.1 hypothetical protein [Streptomyces sp. SHP 1-2]MYU22438.1 hypothetical protein [Streptomyces sp. SID8352]
MRVYVPLTLSGLAEAYRTGGLGTGPLAAYAVTPGLRAWCRTDDVEELEYAALGGAALASLRLLAGDAEAARRRVVVAADVPDAAVADAGAGADAPGAVRVTGDVALDRVAAVHADDPGAGPDVAAAAGALAAADGGDGAAGRLVDAAEEHELLWFATQEIPGLVGSGD